MNRTTLILLLLVLLLTGAYFLLKEEKHEKTEAIRDKMTFAIENKDDVHRIFIAQRGKDALTMTRGNKYWYMDSGQEVSPFAMKTFLQRLEDFRVDYVPGEGEIEAALPVLSAKGVKVELYDKNDDLMMTYYVGGLTQGEESAYFFKEGSDQPYVVKLSYGKVNVRHMFTLSRDQWKNRTIYKHAMEDIAAVHVRYPGAPQQGFDLTRSGSAFDIQPTEARKINKNHKADPDQVEKYLLAFKGLSFLGINNQVIERDSIIGMMPFMDLKMVTVEEDTIGIQVWPKRLPVASPYDAYTKLKDEDEYLALNHMDDFGSLPHSVLKKFLAGYSDLVIDE